MTKRRKDTDYLFLSARIRAMERRLLTAQRLEQLLTAPSVEACAQLLSEWGYAPVHDEPSLQAALSAQREAVFADVSRFMPDAEVLDVFRLKYDYHNIKTLLKLCPKGKVQGIDYSAVSVEKARKVNAGAIAAGQCTVQQASVAELPFEAEQFDVVTAFETVYFWPELAQNFREVYRVLKPGGTFFICNEANGETAKDDKWTQIINGMTIYTDADLKVYLEQAGFGRVQSHKNKKGWMCVTAQK